MRCLLLIVVICLPFIMAAPDKRFLFDKDSFMALLTPLLSSDTTKTACMAECHNLIHGFFGSLCDSLCTEALNALAGR